MLCACKTVLEKTHLGDVVIVFREGNTNHFDHIVHRVVSVNQDYLITQGDNNLKPDAQIVTIDNLVGLVTSFSRHNHVYPVMGGTLGLFYARLIYARNHSWLLIKRLGWRIYRHIRQNGLIARVWRPSISQIRLVTNNGYLVKYCHDNRTVARWWSETKAFEVVKPFDLVIPRPEGSK
jgi:hypothetical protein